MNEDIEHALHESQKVDPNRKILKKVAKAGWYVIFPTDGPGTVVTAYYKNSENYGSYSFLKIFNAMIFNFNAIRDGHMNPTQFWNIV